MRRCAFALALVGASVDGFFMPHVPVSLRQEAATSTSRPGFVSGWIIPAPWSVAQLGRHGLGSDVARGAAGRRALANACTGDANARPKVVRAAQQQETITGRSVDWVRGGAGGPKANRVTGKRMEAADGQPANPISGTSQRSEASSQEPNLMQLTGMIKRCGSVRDLALLVRQYRGKLNHIHISAAWGSLARMHRPWRVLSGNVGRNARREEAALAEALGGRTREVLLQMGGREIANVVHSQASLHIAQRARADAALVDALLARAEEHARERAEDFKAQEIANLVWALAKMDVRVPRGLFDSLSARAVQDKEMFDPQGIANLLWAVAKMDVVADATLIQAMVQQAIAVSGRFNPQGVTNLMWALAKMEIPPDAGLVGAMGDRAMVLVDDFNAQNIANMMWALAKMGEGADPVLCKALGRRAVTTSGAFKPQEISNTMWAFAKVELLPDDDMVEALGQQAVARAADFCPQDVSNLMWAMATMGKHVDMLLWEAMEQRAREMAREFNPQEVANLLWACTCLDLPQDADPAPLFSVMAARCLALRDEFVEANKLQLHQWLVACEFDPAIRASLPAERLSRVREELAGEAKRAFLDAPVTGSRLQDSVAGAMRQYLGSFPGIEMLEEFRDPRSAYSIDFLLRRRGESGQEDETESRWAVEVDGPAHYFKGVARRTPTGNTLLKRKHLAMLGYTLVAVPYWEWNKVDKRGQDAAARYFESKLILK